MRHLTISGLGKVAVAAAGTAALVGGAVGYAKYDMSFRSTLEESIPYADVVLSTVIGEKEITPAAVKPEVKTQDAPKPIKPAAPIQPSLLQKKLERETKKEEVVKSTTPLKPIDSIKPSIIPAPPLPPLEKPSKENKPVVEAMKEPTDAKNLSNSPLVGDSSRTKKREEEVKKLASEKEQLSTAKSTQTPDAEKSKPESNIDESLREQLKLQLAAYQDYLKDQLHLQKQELTREHSLVMEERLLQEKIRYQQDLVASIARLGEIERVLQGKC